MKHFIIERVVDKTLNRLVKCMVSVGIIEAHDGNDAIAILRASPHVLSQWDDVRAIEVDVGFGLGDGWYRIDGTRNDNFPVIYQGVVHGRVIPMTWTQSPDPWLHVAAHHLYLGRKITRLT